MNIRGMIFDLDGTLGDTLPVCIAATRHAFEKFLGRRYTEELPTLEQVSARAPEV